jgi:hypothetical protein
MHHAILRSVWLPKESNGSNSPLQENILSHPFTIALQSTYNCIDCYDDYNIKIIPTCTETREEQDETDFEEFTAAAATLFTFAFFAMTAPTVHADGPCRRRVTSVGLCDRRRTVDFRYAPLATKVAWRCNMSRSATSGLLHRSNSVSIHE